MNNLFANIKPVVGVIHVGALPGTPASSESVDELVRNAVREARVYNEAHVDGIIIENMHDVPYMKGTVGPEIVAAMAVIGRAVKDECRFPVGIQILAAANVEAMAVAYAAALDFVRAEGFIFAHVADEGLIESSAANLFRYRRMIGAENIKVWADVKKKHSAHAITADINIGAMAETVEFMCGDAVIITGNVTGDPPQPSDVLEAKAHCSLPIMLGSGVDLNNITDFYSIADGFIIGSYFKAGGHWVNTVDKERIERLMEVVERLRGQNY